MAYNKLSFIILILFGLNLISSKAANTNSSLGIGQYIPVPISVPAFPAFPGVGFPAVGIGSSYANLAALQSSPYSTFGLPLGPSINPYSASSNLYSSLNSFPYFGSSSPYAAASNLYSVSIPYMSSFSLPSLLGLGSAFGPGYGSSYGSGGYGSGGYGTGSYGSGSYGSGSYGSGYGPSYGSGYGSGYGSSYGSALGSLLGSAYRSAYGSPYFKS